MSALKASSITRRTLLQAAHDVVLRSGVEKLTLEAVAHEAGVSKGGLLYHFPSKRALIEGMLSYLLEGFEADLEREQKEDEGLPDATHQGRWLRAYLRSTFASDPQAFDISAGLIAALNTNPELLAPVQTRFAQWQQQAEEDGLDPALATIIRLATDGLWFTELLGLAPPTGTLREQVLATLLKLTSTRERE